MSTNDGNGKCNGEVTGFTFGGVHIEFSKGDELGIIGIYQGDDAVETTVENMTEICIQWLAFHDPDVLKVDNNE